MFKRPGFDGCDSTLMLIGGEAVIVGDRGHDGAVVGDQTALNASWSQVDATIRGQLLQFIEEQSSISLSEGQLGELLGADAALIADVLEWGVDDTEVGGRVASKLSGFLLGRDWPTFGGQENVINFLDDLRVAAAARGIAVMVSVPASASWLK